jgi:hypothetical protein
MSILLIILFVVDAGIFVASVFRQRGYAVADQICLNAYGMCDIPLWLGAAAVVLFALFFAVQTGAR